MAELWNMLIEAISFPVVISFLLGIFFGITIGVIIYLILVIKTIKEKPFDANKIDNVEIKARIIQALESTKKIYKEEGKSSSAQKHIELISKLSINLVENIAKAFYPKSKYPMSELSINEALELNRYITQRIDKLLSRKGLRVFRKLKLSQIIYIYDVKKRIDDLKVVEAAKKYNVSKSVKILFGIINLPNPVYWGRKIAISFGFKTGLKALGGIILDMVADETIKVYSRNVYNKEDLLGIREDSNIIEELEKLLIEEHNE